MTNLISEKEVLSENSQLIRLSGELDIHSAPLFKDEVLSSITGGCLHIIIDLDDLLFLDSRGLGTFIAISRLLKDRQGTLKLICSNDAILRIFTRTGLNEIFQMFDSREAALSVPSLKTV
ncbi:MAG: STAS domain-containing protein [Candidatus Eremiobacteraeota bacterium]|nr:STAS domain-containing protein [Candidatus Eremiobacteraeota bacterium]